MERDNEEELNALYDSLVQDNYIMIELRSRVQIIRRFYSLWNDKEITEYRKELHPSPSGSLWLFLFNF